LDSRTQSTDSATFRLPRPRPTDSLYALIAIIAACITLAGWSVRGRVPLLHNLEGQVVDAQLRARGPIAPASRPAISILMVDDRTIEEIGRLPIDRGILADVVDRLRADGAAWIVFDMLFAEPSRQEPGADESLADAIGRAGNVALPYALAEDHVGAEPAKAPDYLLSSAYTRYRNEELGSLIDLRPTRIVAPIPSLVAQAKVFGHVSVKPGADGAIRYDLPALWFDDEFFPSLAVSVTARAIGSKWAAVEARLGDSIRIGEHAIPLDVVSRQWVNYYGPAKTFPTYSLIDLVAGRLAPGLFKDRIVLIGGTALGYSDRHPSPFDSALPGVERLATVVDNVITGRWLARPAWAAPIELIGMIAFPLLATLLIARLRPLKSLSLIVLGAAAFVAAAQGVFIVQRLFISMAFPLFSLMFATGLGVAYRAWLDERSRRKAEARLRASEQRYALATRGANDGIWDWDIDRKAFFFSARARQLMDIDETVPATSFDIWLNRLGQVERERFQHELDAHLSGSTQQFHHILCFEREDEPRWLLVRGVAVRETGRPVRMAGSITDITEQKRLEKQIAFDALHDRLTGLANRDLFSDRLSQLLEPHGRATAPDVGLILVDIDDFQAINELRGQVAGNTLLVEAASRLEKLQSEGFVVARVGADQFAIAFLGPFDLNIAQRIQALFAEPFPLDDTVETVTTTVVLAHTNQGLASTDELLSAVTLALVHAKREGRALARSFDPAIQELENSRRWIEDNIDLALAAGNQFMLYYQPFVRLSDRVLIGFEALIRWRHPERGMIMPSDFIPHAEQSGRINAIGRWSLFEVARQLVAWDRVGFKGEIAVNLSSRQFTENNLEADMSEVLTVLGAVSPNRYKLEVTESMAMANPQRTSDVLNSLAAMGFKISIDDFGTGYSSLAYLYRFPFNTLKIDRSFVIRLGSGREAQEIVRTIVELGAALGKQVLAEGIEEEAQASMLNSLGVQVGQGWLFSRALPVDEATKLL
jgi:diguanylate cyclase (GGDEF)-like protein/PAS domain S-box-containing protein